MNSRSILHKNNDTAAYKYKTSILRMKTRKIHKLLWYMYIFEYRSDIPIPVTLQNLLHFELF